MRLCLPSTRLALRGRSAALDTRVVLRLTMTPISPTSRSRRFSPFYLFLLRFVISSPFFSFFMLLFFNVLISASSRFLSPCRYVRGSSGDVYLAFFIPPFDPVLTQLKYSAIYKYVIRTTQPSFHFHSIANLSSCMSSSM